MRANNNKNIFFSPMLISRVKRAIREGKKKKTNCKGQEESQYENSERKQKKFKKVFWAEKTEGGKSEKNKK